MKIINILFNHKSKKFKKSKLKSDDKVFGVEQAFVDYTTNLTKQNHEVLSIIKPNMAYRNLTKDNSSKMFEVQALGKGDIFTIIKMAFIFVFFKPEIVICHSGRALHFARMAKILSFQKAPIIAIDHGSNPQKFLKADYVFTVNSFFSKKLVELGMPQNRAIAVPNALTIPKNFVSKTKNFNKPIKIGSLGRLAFEKYFDQMLYALKILKDQGFECEYLIGGVGKMDRQLLKLAKQLGVQNQFKLIGWVDNKKEFFEKIDIFVLPSFCETFGIVLLEAMLYKTPIITTNSWGPDEIIDHEINGLKVSKDIKKLMPKLLAEAILKLANNQEFAKKLAENAYKKLLDNYESEVVFKRVGQLLEEIKWGVRKNL